MRTRIGDTPFLVPALVALALAGACPAARAADDPASAAVERQIVTFTAIESDARGVSLVGDFNTWDSRAHPMTRNGEGIWSLSIPLRASHVYEYGFVVDGVMVRDARNPVKTDDGQFSLLYVPSSGPEKAGSLPGDYSDPKAVVIAFKRLEEKLSFLSRNLSALSDQMVKLNDLVVKKDAQVDLLRTEQKSLQEEKIHLSRDLVEARAKTEDLSSRYDEVRQERDRLSAQVQDLAKRYETSDKEARDAQTRMNAALQTRRVIESQYEDARRKLDSAEKALGETNNDYISVKRELEARRLMAAAADNSIPAGPESDLRMPRPLRNISGKVLGASQSDNLLVLDCADGQGVKVGDEFVVLREGKLVAKCVVDVVDKEQSIGHVLTGFDAKAVQVDDAVSLTGGR